MYYLLSKSEGIVSAGSEWVCGRSDQPHETRKKKNRRGWVGSAVEVAWWLYIETQLFMEQTSLFLLFSPLYLRRKTAFTPPQPLEIFPSSSS